MIFNLSKRKNETPEEILRHDVQIIIGKMAMEALADSGLKGTPLEGVILTGGVSSAKDYLLNRSTAISEDYNVSREVARKIMKECAEKYIKIILNG